ncbi:MFS general substrate transporter [Meredithblackwellia eburnea MCA 4105]
MTDSKSQSPKAEVESNVQCSAVPTHNEKGSFTDSDSPAVEAIQLVGAYTPEEDAKLLRRIDWFLMPIMMIYGLNFADKLSLSYSALFGIIKDNKLHGTNFSWLSTIFYLAYMCAEIPVNWLMQKYEVGQVLGVLMVLWGAFVMLIAACHNFTELMVVRALIGAAESAISPGFLLIVSQYYTTNEHASRVLIWTSMNQAFSMFTGIITYLLGRHSLLHPGTIAGWKSINLFLGSLTVAWGFVMYLFIGSPDRVRFLSPEQKLHTKARIVASKTNSHVVHTWNWAQVWECFRDPQVYLIFVYTFVVSMPNGGISTFQSLILSGLGFDSLGSTLLAIPIAAFSVTVFIITIFIMKRWPTIRLLLAAFFTLPSAACFLALILLPAKGEKYAKYGVMFMSPLFALSLFLVWSLIPSNIAGRTKKSVVSAVTFIGYTSGNAAGPQVFKTSDAPRYVPGLVMCVACLILNSVIAIVWRQYYIWMNNKRDRDLVANNISLEEKERLGEIAGESDQTDLQNVHFRYTW